MKTGTWFPTLFIFAFLSLAYPASADGIIIPVPDPSHPPVSLRSLAIKYHHAQENTDDQMATTRVDQVFVNESPQDIEGSISFPFQKTSLSQRSPWE